MTLNQKSSCFYYPFTCSLKFSIVYKITLQSHWPANILHQRMKGDVKNTFLSNFVQKRFDSSSSLRKTNTRYHKATFCMIFLNLKLKILIKIHNRKGGIRSTSCIKNFLYLSEQALQIWSCRVSKQQLWYNCKFALTHLYSTAGLEKYLVPVIHIILVE